MSTDSRIQVTTDRLILVAVTLDMQQSELEERSLREPEEGTIKFELNLSR